MYVGIDVCVYNYQLRNWEICLLMLSMSEPITILL